MSIKGKQTTIIITAGGTSEKIDDVRSITNFSSGALGSAICDDMLERIDNIKIFFVCSKLSVKPMQVSQKPDNILEIVNVSDVASLKSAIENIMKENRVDYFIHSAAVSDYTTDYITDSEMLAEQIAEEIEKGGSPKGQKLVELINKSIINNNSVFDRSGKVSSSTSNPIILLKKTPKLISYIKTWQPQTFLVGFKLLKGVTKEHLIRIGYEQMRRNGCDLVVANDLCEISEQNHKAYILFPDEVVHECNGKKAIAAEITNVLIANMNK